MLPFVAQEKEREREQKPCVLIMAGVTGYIGPRYRFDSVFDLSTMQPYNLNDLLDLFLSLADDVILYLPRTSDLRQLAARAQGGENEKMTVMHYCMEGASKVCLTPIPSNIYARGGVRRKKKKTCFFLAG